MKTMNNLLVQYGRSTLSVIFLAVILAGPICAVCGILMSSGGFKLAGIVATVLNLV
jgi:hypothetical protein